MSRRLLYVVNSPDFFVSHRLELARAAAARGFDVTVASPQGAGAAIIREAGLGWTHLAMERSGRNPIDELGLIRTFVALYRRMRPHIVHHVTIKPVLYGTLAARLTRVPRVVNAISGMGFLFGADRPLQRRLGTAAYHVFLRHPDMAIIVQNEADRAFFVANRLAPEAAITLIPGSGVDPASFDPHTPRAYPPIVVQTCRMLAEKGVREFIAAARLLRADFPTVRFVLVGAPDPGNPTSIRATELETAAREGAIEWWGHRTDIPVILGQASIYCLASSYREGLPKSLIEAAAAGLPLVTSNTPGCREVVRHGENGLLVPPRNATALASAIARLLRDPALGLRLGLVARADAERRFALKHIIAAQLALYEA